MKELSIEALLENLQIVNDFISEPLDLLGCSKKCKMQLDLVVEEIFVNIASYAYDPPPGIAKIRYEIQEEPRAIILTFVDTGVPYNPLEKADPDTTAALNERQIGGLGIFLVKNMVDDISYEYKDKQNILTLKKLIRQC